MLWHYQWAVLTDFLPTVAGNAETNKVVKHSAAGWTTNLQFYNSCTTPMPVEFSVAAYRFGGLDDLVDAQPAARSTARPSQRPGRGAGDGRCPAA